MHIALHPSDDLDQHCSSSAHLAMHLSSSYDAADTSQEQLTQNSTDVLMTSGPSEVTVQTKSSS